MILRLEGQDRSRGSMEAGHCSAATKAAIKCALDAASEFDSSRITISMLGNFIVLEGFVRCHGDDELAVNVAASIVGRTHVHNRMICQGFPKNLS
jgi:osmotically-inducible protein OsmY